MWETGAGAGPGERSLGRGTNETPPQWTGLGIGGEMPTDEVSEAGPLARCRGGQT